MLTPLYTNEQFAQALASPRPVLIIWGMTGCGACQETKPVVRRYSMSHQDVDAYEVNVNQLPMLADAHRISATPTLMLFMGGKRAARRTGSLTEQQLERWVDKVRGGE